MGNVDLIKQLENLGLVAQKSSDEELREHLRTGCRTVYCGFDPTADSLHAGNLVPLLALRRFQLAGHRPILLIGGATGMIGDPKATTERELKSQEVVREYAEIMTRQAMRFLDFDCGDCSAIVVNNADWTENLTVVDYLRDIGKHFSVNTMIQKETIRRRLEDDSSGISYTEFSYMVLQSYDFVVLNRKYDCTLQMGGSDQWGNITMGIDLVRRIQSRQAYALTYPLMTKADGTKFGKSEAGTIWLDEKKTSPYVFYQFWLNTDDKDVINFLKIFTFLSLDEIRKLEANHEQDPGKRAAHISLAMQVTRLVHGEAGLEAAQRITEALFSNRLEELSDKDLQQLALDGLETTRVDVDRVSLMDMLVEAKLAVTPRGEVTSGQARKLLKSNAVSVNGIKISDEDFMLEQKSALHGHFHILQKGKKNHHLVIMNSQN